MATPSPKRRRVDNGDETPSRRHLYMSPTKASIARFNPNVLSIPKSPALALGLPAAEDIVIGSTNRPETGVVGNVRTRDPAKSNSDRPEPTLAATPAPATSGLFLTPAENGDTVRQQNRLATTNVSPSRRLGTYRSPNEVTSTGTGGLTNSPTSAELERESQNQSSDPASRAQQATYLDQLKQPTQHDLEAETRWIAKRAQRDELLRSLREIRRETRQIEVQLNPDIRHSGSEKECEEMVAAISLLNSSASSGQKSKPPTLTSMLSSFLPFSRPIVQHSEAPEQDRAEADISHRPVDLENPLPFLTMFTSLAYSEDIAPLAESLANDGNTYRELHNITARSPLSLLTVAIRMVTQTSLRESLAAPLPTIEKLSIDSISPWASVELLPTLQLHARNNEIGSLSNALNTYWLLCLARAECWVRCETSFQHLLDITANKDQENYAETTKLGQGGRKTKRTRAGSNVVEEQANTASREEQRTPWTRNFSRKDLLPNIGRNSITFKSKDLHLRILWQIQFDWTGEAQSVVSADASFPESWRDERKLLENIPSTFASLVKTKGVFNAVKVLIGLLM